MCACLTLKFLIPDRIPWFYMDVGAILFDTSKRIWVACEVEGTCHCQGSPRLVIRPPGCSREGTQSKCVPPS